MRYYIIAGEVSGDLHSSNLIFYLKKLDPSAEFRAWGGDLMAGQGAEIVKHISELAIMGLYEVLANINAIRKNFRFCKKDVLLYKPDVLILVDYPGFNLRIARFARKHNIKVFYYISPTVWAWHTSRVKQVKKYVVKMYCILPFEKQFYKNYGIEVEYFGHPLVDLINNHYKKEQGNENIAGLFEPDNRPVVALLPGSRKQEIKKNLPLILEVIKNYSQFQFVLCGVSSIPVELYKQFLNNNETKLIFDNTYSILRCSYAAIVVSGTASLEAALFRVPQVVCYKTSRLTFAIARMFVKVKYISLVNLILEDNLICELIQSGLNKSKLALEFEKLSDNENRIRILNGYDKLIKLLEGNDAPERIAMSMYNALTKTENV